MTFATQATLEDILRRAPRWCRSPILAGYRGSHCHGTYIPPTEPHSTDDVDVFAVTVRQPEYYFGVSGYLGHKESWNSNSEHIDIEAHDIRKFVHLLEKGNPNVHTYVWLDPEDYFKVSRAGRILLDHRRSFLSRRMFQSFAGYAYAQLKRMQKFEKKGYMGTKREALMREYGYDIKNAAHCIRLLSMAIHLVETGELMVRLRDPILDQVMTIKRGESTYEDVRRLAERLFRRFDQIKDSALLPDKVDRAFSDEVCTSVIRAHWEDMQTDAP